MFIKPGLGSGKVYQMYISLETSRAKGFMRWADAHQPEKGGDTRAGASEDRVVTAPDLEGLTTPPQPLHRA